MPSIESRSSVALAISLLLFKVLTAAVISSIKSSLRCLAPLVALLCSMVARAAAAEVGSLMDANAVRFVCLLR